MGNYITVDDLLPRKNDAEILRLTIEPGDTALNADVVEALIADAEAEMDLLFMKAGYVVPIVSASVPIVNILRRIAYDILIQRLYKSTYDDYPADVATKQMYIDYNKSREMLNKIASGELMLYNEAKLFTAAAPLLTNKSTTDRKMTELELLGNDFYNSYLISGD